MTDPVPEDENPLLEIDILQLSGLFGSGQHKTNSSVTDLLFPAEFTQATIDALDELDIYRISQQERHEIFIRAAYKAFLNSEPSKADIADDLRMLNTSRDGHRSIIDKLTKIRDEYIQKFNEDRQNSINLTIKNIDHWNRPKTLLWRK